MKNLALIGQVVLTKKFFEKGGRRIMDIHKLTW